MTTGTDPARRVESAVAASVMARFARRFLSLAFAAVSFLGCAAYTGTARPAVLDDLRVEKGWVLLDSVPFVKQATQWDCGAASLAMVLGHWGLDVPVATLEAECAAEGEEGLRASALRDATRRRGLSAFLFRGRVEDLQHELARGRPILVGMARPHVQGPTSHFEVVVGFHAGLGRVALLDPANGLVIDSLTGFLSEWFPTKCVTLVVFLPETKAPLPQSAGN